MALVLCDRDDEPPVDGCFDRLCRCREMGAGGKWFSRAVGVLLCVAASAEFDYGQR
jgi:hypothetical protein